MKFGTGQQEDTRGYQRIAEAGGGPGKKRSGECLSSFWLQHINHTWGLEKEKELTLM